MKDADYLKILRKKNPDFVKHMKFIIKNVFPHSKKLENIHSALINPNEFFQALSLYQSSKKKSIPQDDLAYVVASIILFNPFLLKSNIGKKWLKRFDEFYTVFVEANPKIAYTQNIYLDASMVFNLALTNDIQGSPLSITKLYLGDGSELSQGSSVFLEKENVKKNSYVTTLGVSSTTFFNELQSYFEKKFEDYDVILRLNCEGVEDEVIYAAHNSFGKKLKLICGSLKDVEGVKGLEASQRLDKFIKDNRLLFVNFHSGMISWLEAHAAVLNLLEEKQNLKK